MTRLQIQTLRFIVVGVLSNTILYLAYLLVTWLGLDPKIAMTLVYVAAIVGTFVINRRWTFGAHSISVKGFLKYLVVYAFGYLVNLAILFVAVDNLGAPHQWVQLFAIGVVAVVSFLGQKFWVFRPE
jgi:putative flippase GtrA